MIEINNLTSVFVDRKYLKKISEKVLRKEKEKKDLSVALISPGQIKKLNKKYRKKNRPTDILSFSYDNYAEIVICPQKVKNNAKKYHSTFKKELSRVLIHGILHLVGYEHEKNPRKKKLMEKKENYYFNYVKN
ncbi:MAG: rRNA maturation RNase YbeY [Candidatus Nealsonbacteria bacterium RBG_13_42_11]|uniref:Endoribonuclease YbeY n=1 Tax=Candidatus Nealsonbacteria bacterium RBG_13_42_11 TaxID=1801663 RepID=A0A1G2E017_9BACT|nr:MAG: rRNA maturation RNase YbeY [Candidatus Nealsonbacteria bacterium RBG_13_42_11]